jgi:EAL domain-containing protein (putative c-di-GMP-specific phosphodiesterase class I)
MPLPVIQPAMPIETDAHVLRARRTAAKTRIALGVIGIALILADPGLLPHPALGIVGFATIELTALVQLGTWRPSLLKVEESAAGLAAVLIIGLGSQDVSALSILWLAAIASGVMARGGRVHWLGSVIVMSALALPVIREQQLSASYAAMCAAVLGLLLTCGRLTRELNHLLRQARRQAESAETLLLAGDIAARMAEREDSSAAGVAGAAVAGAAAGAAIVASTRGAAGADAQPSPRAHGQPLLSAEEIASAREALARLIAGEGLTMVVQPIVDMSTGSAHAYEALARFGQPREDGSPLHWFALAEELGERAELERACLRKGLELHAHRPRGTSLSLNLSAPVLLEAATMLMLEEAGDALPDELSGLIVEITEETLVHSDMELAHAIEPLRARGARLAVDDMGAGYSGLRQITSVLPSYLKLDRSLVTGIDTDSERAALVGALAGYSKQVGSLLVAEGVETEAELWAIRRLGVPLVQGFYLSRPGPPWPEIRDASGLAGAPASSPRATGKSAGVDVLTPVG